MSEEKKVAWTVRISKEEVRVYMQMINFDHSVGKFKDLKPNMSFKWGGKHLPLV